MKALAPAHVDLLRAVAAGEVREGFWNTIRQHRDGRVEAVSRGSIAALGGRVRRRPPATWELTDAGRAYLAAIGGAA